MEVSRVGVDQDGTAFGAAGGALKEQQPEPHIQRVSHHLESCMPARQGQLTPSLPLNDSTHTVTFITHTSISTHPNILGGAAAVAAAGWARPSLYP